MQTYRIAREGMGERCVLPLWGQRDSRITVEAVDTHME